MTTQKKKPAPLPEKKEIRMQEQLILRWPDGQFRTRIQDREQRNAWKRTWKQYLDALDKEMVRMKAVEYLVTRDGDNRDPGVAVFFSRKAVDNYGWQETFGLIGVIPTEEQIQSAYHRLAKIYAPDNPLTGDPARFREITEHRDRARDWANGRQRKEHEYGIGCDAFTEARWNLNAIILQLSYFRRSEALGCTVMFEQMMSAFTKKALTAGAGDGAKKA
jgi:hypothetical protein